MSIEYRAKTIAGKKTVITAYKTRGKTPSRLSRRTMQQIKGLFALVHILELAGVFML